MKKVLVPFLLALTLTASASTIYPVQKDEGFFSKVFSTITRCKLSFSCYTGKTLGTSITTINGSDLIKDSRATINTNFANLNSGKFELSDWYATSTFLQASTTISANQVLLGNGTAGLKVVTGWGSSGEVLTSTGAASAPTWQALSVDQTANYLWTGNHNFTGTNHLVKNLGASSTVANPLTLNGLAYDIQSSRAASSTVLTEDGSGHLKFLAPSVNANLVTTGLSVTTTAAATTTFYTYKISAGTLTGTNKALRITGMWEGSGNSSNCRFDMQYGNGSASTTIIYGQYGTTNSVNLSVTNFFATSNSTQKIHTTLNGSDSAASTLLSDNTIQLGLSNSTVDLTADSYISFRGFAVSGGTCTIKAITVETLTQ